VSNEGLRALAKAKEAAAACKLKPSSTLAIFKFGEKIELGKKTKMIGRPI
jgi:hypothetical protein